MQGRTRQEGQIYRITLIINAGKEATAVPENSAEKSAGKQDRNCVRGAYQTQLLRRGSEAGPGR
jgi:hypothetical protein